MNSIGAEVRQEREKQGLSLEDVSERTRITVQNLEAIEEDSFDSFPNRVYARAFLRDYANFLGLDSASLLDMYEEQRSGTPDVEPTVTGTRHGWRTFAQYALAVLVVALLGAGGYVGWRLHDEYVETTREKAPGSGPAEAERTESPAPPVLSQPQSTPESLPTSAEPEVIPGQNTLKITALDTVWVHLNVDGRRELYTNLSVGTTRTYHPKRKAFIHVGRANAVLLEFNGKPKTLGTKRVPAKWAYP